MSMFYFDEIIKKYENNFSWDEALDYLENKFLKDTNMDIVNSLVGFSWYYLIEGPIDSGKYEKDENENALSVWEKYINIGTQIAKDNQYFYFIAGYTLSLSGFIISPDYEIKGRLFMEKCYNIATDLSLKIVAHNFLKNENSKKYIPLENGRDICKKIFGGDSLLEKYFREIWG